MNKNFGDKPSLVKPIAIVVVILLIIGGAYSFFGKGESKQESDGSPESVFANAEIKSSGIDADESVKNVGDVEEVIAKWIEANPEAIVNSVANMQKKVMEQQRQNAQKSIGSKIDELFNDKNSPEYAPRGYDVTIVEFFDYNCGYCKKAQATVEELISEDKKLRVVYKEFPILGETSTEMSRVALAVNMIDSKSYKKFHDALMKSSKRGEQAAIEVAKSVGINVAKLKSTLKNKKANIDEMIQQNIVLGSSIGVNGTPGFVLGEELIPGAYDAETFKAKIAAVRAKK